MPGPVTREEFDELVDEVAGEKVVTRHILEQTRRNGDDLAGLKTRVGRIEEKVDSLDRKVDGLDRRVGGLEGRMGAVETKLDSLIRDLPRTIADTMREVFAERDKRK
jgi:hypothetical protein